MDARTQHLHATRAHKNKKKFITTWQCPTVYSHFVFVCKQNLIRNVRNACSHYNYRLEEIHMKVKCVIECVYECLRGWHEHARADCFLIELLLLQSLTVADVKEKEIYIFLLHVWSTHFGPNICPSSRIYLLTYLPNERRTNLVYNSVGCIQRMSNREIRTVFSQFFFSQPATYGWKNR